MTNNLLRDLIAALRGTRSFAYLIDMSRSLRSVRLALKPLTTIIKYFLLLLLTGMLAACGSAPAPRLPQALEQAQAADKDARRALRGGELLRAQHNFAKALVLQQSLDDDQIAQQPPQRSTKRASRCWQGQATSQAAMPQAR